MNFSRQRVADTLRRAGFLKAADEAMVELPDPVDLERLQEWGTKRGITKDFLISAMGGSP